MERLAAEEFGRERVRTSRTRPDLDLPFEPAEEAWPSSSRSSTPSSFASQEDAEAAELKAETSDPAAFTPCDAGKAAKELSLFFIYLFYKFIADYKCGEFHRLISAKINLFPNLFFLKRFMDKIVG